MYKTKKKQKASLYKQGGFGGLPLTDMTVWLVSFSFLCFVSFLFAFKKKRNEETVSILLHALNISFLTN